MDPTSADNLGSQMAAALISNGYTPVSVADPDGKSTSMSWTKHDFHFTYPDVLFALVCLAFLVIVLKGWP